MGAAARMAGVHKSTVLRQIQSGKLSAERKEDGSYEIDASELARLYDLQPQAVAQEESRRNGRQPQEQPSAPGVAEESPVVAMLRQQLAREVETVTDLRARLDKSEQHVERLLLALPALARASEPTPAPPAAAPVESAPVTATPAPPPELPQAAAEATPAPVEVPFAPEPTPVEDMATASAPVPMSRSLIPRNFLSRFLRLR
jgi:hypothetical protein